jgi:hypothetical protein
MSAPDDFIPLLEVIPLWPADRFPLPGGNGVLNRVGVSDFDLRESAEQTTLELTLSLPDDLELGIPGLSGFGIVLGGGGDRGTSLSIEIDINDPFAVRLKGVALTIRFPPGFFKPMHETSAGKFEEVKDADGKLRPYEITLSGDVHVDSDGDISIVFPTGTPTISLKPLMIGDTGVVIEADNIQFYFSRKATPPKPELPAGWRGLFIEQAEIHMPDGMSSAVPTDLTFDDCYIGSGGFSGSVSADWIPAFSGSLFGIAFELNHLGISFVQNSITEADIGGKLTLPFFDHPTDVAIGIDLRGDLTVSLTSTGSNGLYKLTKPGVLEMELDSIGFELKDGVFMAKLSGVVTPLFGGLNWPGFKVEELSIDSKGHVHLQGGWLALREQYSLDFHGFHIGITKIGFGKTEDGGKWVGFSGELKLVDGFTAGASVEGLRVTWYEDGRDPKVSFNGIGVEFEIPEVLTFKGDVAYRELEVDGAAVRRFDGDITLNLISLGLEIDAKLVVGSASGGPQGNYNFFAIYLGVELPTGIPLSPTPLALFGLAGLFALQMEPNKLPKEKWYEHWFKKEKVGVTDLESKWVNRRGSMALGFGGTFGTYSDDGFTVAVKALLVLVFPGPIILITGRANLLKERAKLSDEALFEALAVLDMREGQILIGLDAKYKQDEQSGKVIAIEAGAEAFFKDPGNWHVYLGEKEPRAKRIRARILSLFEANSYFMVDPQQLATGAWVGYAKQWKFGPVGVTLETWIEGNVVVNWKPLHFTGDLWLHGNVEVKVFGFGLSLSMDARFAADVFDPFHVVASFEFSFSPPKPFKKGKHIEITLEWGPQKVWPALIPLPLEQVAIEHFKVTTTWPLPKDGQDGTPPLLVPKYDLEKRGLRNYDSNPPSFTAPSLGALPVVPIDCRPRISFGRPVHDDALVGVNPQPPQPSWERVGDPSKDVGPVQVRYSLKQIELSKWDSQTQTWRTVAVAGRPLNSGERKLFGSWAPIPQLPSGTGSGAVANTKLWLWSKTPFDYTRHGGSGVDDWFTANFPHYPCVPQDISDREVCCDFERLSRSQILEKPWRSPEHPEITLNWSSKAPRHVTVLDPPVDGFTRALCFPLSSPRLSNSIMINLSAPAKRVKLWIVEKRNIEKVCIDFRNRRPGNVTLPLNEQGVVFGPDAVAKIISVPTTIGDLTGLNCSFIVPGVPQVGLNVTLPASATVVELMLSYQSPIAFDNSITVAAFNSSDEAIATKSLLNPQRQPEIIRFEAVDIRKIKISSPRSLTILHKICFVNPDTTASVTATGFDVEGHPTQTFENRGNEVEVTGERLTKIKIKGKGEVCLLKICALFGPDPVEVAHREEMAAHLNSEMARWQDEGEVLEPFSAYRLTVVTKINASAPGLSPDTRALDQVEHAFFQTGGPPGLTKLSLPPGRKPEDADKFDSGLEDLTRYVRQTIPATVPALGEKPVMPKPFYRAYDLSVEFNEDYVDLMYRINGRDLGLYTYDSNNRPARDVEGRLLVQTGDWGTVEELWLTEGEQRWLALSNSENRCLPVISTETIAHDKKLTSAIAGRVLEPDMIHEGRLIPLLLREGFQGFATGASASGPAGALGRWQVRDRGDVNAPSQWEVSETVEPVARFLTQTSGIKDSSTDAGDPVKQGTTMMFGADPSLDSSHAEQPSNWTDYRLSTYLSAAAGGAMGLVFRYRDDNNYYRFSMDHGNSYRRLVSVVAGISTVLKQDDVPYELQKDYLITIEAIGNGLRVYQDGMLIFDVTDAAHAKGSIGMYCYDNAGARFSDVRVDDFRQTAPVVYRFQFTTSRFANFFHHLHSYQDETWRRAVEQVPAAFAPMMKAVSPASLTSDSEMRAYETLATIMLGQAARQNPPEVQISRIEIDAAPLAFLLQSPEPIDWLRTEIARSRTNLVLPKSTLPGKVKIVALNFASTGFDIESVVLLLREPLNLTGYRIESRLVEWPENQEIVIDAQTRSEEELSKQAWTTFHLFEKERNLAAGTTLGVRADPNVEPASIDLTGNVSYSVELRLIAPNGNVVHSKHFLPDTNYVSEDVSVLRKADGTGFFMIHLDDSLNALPLSPAQYRLKLTYHRNNRTRIPTSQVLSQAGNDDDEIVTLDIPLKQNVIVSER